MIVFIILNWAECLNGFGDSTCRFSWRGYHWVLGKARYFRGPAALPLVRNPVEL